MHEPWDQYPVVGQLLSIWDATGRYVDTCVDQAYPTDEDVRHDQELHDWMTASASVDGGNIRGLPAMDSKEALETRPPQPRLPHHRPRLRPAVAQR